MKILNKTLLGLGLIGGALLGQSLITEHSAFAQGDTTVGSVRGVIKDQGAAAAGATVVATSSALQGEQTVLTDENGQYFINSLPAGLYTLTVYYNDNTFTRGNVLIQVGKEDVVNIAVNTAVAPKKGEVVVIKGNVPIIDQGSQKTGVTITDDYTRNIPVGRTFGEVLGAAAGSQNDLYGTSISGSTSVENTYIVEGMNTTDTAYGLQSTNLPNEFVNQTEVITGGYNAEYGRATGGIVNVVTKSGSNEFHGSIFGYVTPGGLVSSARTVAQGGGDAITTADNLDVNYDVGAELGGPIIKDKLWFHLGFNPSESNATFTRGIQSQVDANGDGVPDTVGNCNPANPTCQNVEKSVASQDFTHHTRTYFFTGKLSGEINANNTFSISAFGNPTSGTIINNVSTATAPNDLLIGNDSGAYDVTAKYTSKLNDGKTQIDVTGGYHHGYQRQAPGTAAGELTGIEYLYTRSLTDFNDVENNPVVAAACDNSTGQTNPAKPIDKCPVTSYVSQGDFLMQNRQNDRYSGSIALTQRVKLLGYHTFKGGVDIEASVYNINEYYTGSDGYFQRSQDTNLDGTPVDPVTGPTGAGGDFIPGGWTQNTYDHVVRFLTPAEAEMVATTGTIPNIPAGDFVCATGTALCTNGKNHVATTSDRSIGAFLQDSWQIVPSFTVDVGVRFEQQTAFNAKELQGETTVFGTIPDAAFTLNNWAPRIGFNWDPTDEGKSKLFGHFGRFYENIPMDINARSYGGEIDGFNLFNQTNGLTAQQLAAKGMGFQNCNVDHKTANAIATIEQCPDEIQLGFGGLENTAPGLSGQYTQEFIFGGEYELMPDFKLGLTYTHRSLPQIIEDMSADNANTYIIANPGENYDSAAATLQAQGMKDIASNPVLGQEELTEANTLKFIKTLDPPSRTYDAVTVTATQRPTKESLLIASYTYSKELGNYPGLFSTETGQLDPNITSQYDLPQLLANRYGKLGLDRPHLLKIDGFKQFDLKEAGLFTVGVSFRAQSGIAHNALGLNTVYTQTPGEVYVLPRGTFARSPTTDEVDIHLQYGRRVGKDKRIDVFANIFNLFNQQDELSTDETYTFNFVNPIVGGDAADLTHLKSVTSTGQSRNVQAQENPDFGHTTAYTAPRSVQFGARLSF